MAKHVVAAVAEIPPGGRKLVEVNGRAVVVFNLGGEFFALSNRCPHRGGSLCDGILTGLVQSNEPGEYNYSAAARSSAAPGTPGSSTSAPESPGAIPPACGCGNIRWRWSRARSWSKAPMWPKRSR